MNRRNQTHQTRPFPVEAGVSPGYERRCAEALEWALDRVPGYAAWRARDPGPSASIDERYSALPFLTKADIRAHYPDGFVTRGYDRKTALRNGTIEWVRTSGTTDDQVKLVWNEAWWSASEKASWRLHSRARRVATGRHREAVLTSPLCAGVVSRSGRPISRKRRTLRRLLFLNEIINPADWTDAHLERMIRELGEFKPGVLEANPTLLARLARFIADVRRDVFQPGLIVLTYEWPSQIHLRDIRRAFRAPVVSSYGSTETGTVFMQCEEGNFHQNVDCCRVDFQPLKKEHGGPAVGRIFVTTFENRWFPVLRFNVGDLVRLAGAGSCGCGRKAGLTLSAVEGRVKDLTFTVRGRAVTLDRLDRALGGLEGVSGYRLRQTGRKAYELLLMAEGADRADTRRRAEAALRAVYGREARVSVRFQDLIEPVVCKHRLAETTFAYDAERLFDGRYA